MGDGQEAPSGVVSECWIILYSLCSCLRRRHHRLDARTSSKKLDPHGANGCMRCGRANDMWASRFPQKPASQSCAGAPIGEPTHMAPVWSAEGVKEFDESMWSTPSGRRSVVVLPG